MVIYKGVFLKTYTQQEIHTIYILYMTIVTIVTKQVISTVAAVIYKKS